MHNFVAIDFETATFVRNSICQIGIAEVVDGVVMKPKTWLVQPPENFYFFENIEIHGITPEMTENEPLFPDVWKEVAPYLEGKKVVAHNVSFDMYVLKETLDLYGLEYPNFEFVCSYRISQVLYPGMDSHKLNILAEAFGANLDKHHDAGADAVACAEIMLKFMQAAECSIDNIADHCYLQNGVFSPSEFRSCVKKGRWGMKERQIKEALACVDSHDPLSPFYQKKICLTGTFQKAKRSEIYLKIASIGGLPMDSISKQTDYLFISNKNYTITDETKMSSKQKTAIQLQKEGAKIQIFSEDDFYTML